MVRAGLGIALLPSFVEHQLPELQALTTPIKEMRTPLWLITHPELKNTMRIKVMLRAFGPALAHLLQTTKSEAEPSPEAG
jgi:DNA-binding transcriptional LysR family regulator